MADMLVRLYDLPARSETPHVNGVVIRRANAFEMSRIRKFVEKHFSQTWADEIQVAYANKPVSLFIAIVKGKIVGFAAYECTRRGFFGPTGVMEKMRNKGIGGALLLAGLEGLREMGYAYAIIGGAGPAAFYTNACGATIIEGSTPGVYRDPLKKPD
jgi:predicted N-acetyltransferase YhbS